MTDRIGLRDSDSQMRTNTPQLQHVGLVILGPAQLHIGSAGRDTKTLTDNLENF